MIPESPDHPGRVVSNCLSTMDLAWDLIHQGRLPEWGWVRAEQQTRGRGQYGRTWVCAKGDLMVSVRLPDAADSLGPLLSLVLAGALIRVLNGLSLPARIKWPNDIVLGRTKAGGILTEQRGSVILAGIGMNLVPGAERSGTEKFFHFPAGSLAEYHVRINPSRLWTLILEELCTTLPRTMRCPQAASEELKGVLAFTGENIHLADTGICDGPARILGIDREGKLQVQSSDGRYLIHSGRICLGKQ